MLSFIVIHVLITVTFFYFIQCHQIPFGFQKTFLLCHKLIFAGGHLGLFQIRYIGMTQYVYAFVQFSDLENIGVDPKIFDSMSIRTGDIFQIRFSWRPF